MPPSVPSYLGPYRLLNVVHTSRTCLIWQASDDGKQKILAIKALRSPFCEDREQIGCLRWEYTVSRKTVHPRIIEIYSYGSDRGIPHIAMEWFPAPNMKEFMHRGLEKIKYLAPKIIAQAAEGLAFMHENRWVHRDVKPANFLVRDDGEVKLIDLGLAVRARRGLAKLFSRTKPQGTKSYMAPEQIRGEALDERADVYGFGCVVYELIVGRPPFTGATTQELFAKHLRTPPPALDAAEPNVTAEFSQLIRRCLSKSPADRPATAGDFLDELQLCKVFRVIPRASGASAV